MSLRAALAALWPEETDLGGALLLFLSRLLRFRLRRRSEILGVLSVLAAIWLSSDLAPDGSFLIGSLF